MNGSACIRNGPVEAIVFLHGGALRSPVQRSHHLARHFADRLPVIYVPYRSPLEMLQGDVGASEWRPLSAHPALRCVALPPTTFLSRRSRAAARLHGFIAAAGIRRTLRYAGLAPERILAFLELATAVDVLRYFPGIPVVYDCADDFRQWPDASPAMSRLYAEMESELARTADCIIASTPHWLERFTSSPARKIVGLNGVDIDERAPSGEPPDLAGIPRPRLLYAGIGSRYVDAAIVSRLAASGAGSVVIVGPVDARAPLARLRGVPNTFWLGRKPYEALATYAAWSDVGLIPATGHPASDRVPSKLLLYCAAGLPVVARRCSSLGPYEGRILLAGSPDDYVAQVLEALRNPSFGRSERRDLARSNTWKALAERLLVEMGVLQRPVNSPLAR